MADDMQKQAHGCIKDSIVKVPKDWALVVLIVNIIFPGIGTIIAGYCDGGINTNCLGVGILQMLTAWLIIGWIWSIWWGVQIYEKSK